MEVGQCENGHFYDRDKYAACPWCHPGRSFSLDDLCRGRSVSILGDSIGTYAGVNPPGYQVFYEMDACADAGLRSVTQTWWHILIRALNAKLCVNASYSGRKVSGKAPHAGWKPESIKALCTADILPDVVIVWLGVNDMGYGVPVWGKNRSEADADCFFGAYDRMLMNLRTAYPKSVIICGTLIKTYLRDQSWWTYPEVYARRLQLLNQVIREKAVKYRVWTADLERTGMIYESMDGTHPTVRGHAEIAKAWEMALQNRC